MDSAETLKTIPARLGTVAGQVTRTSLPSDADFMRSCLAKCQVDRISPTRNRATRSLAFQMPSVGQHRMKATMSLSRSPLSQRAIRVVDGVGHRNLQVRFGATLDSYAGVKAKKIGNPQPLDLRRPNLVAGRVTLKLDDSESALPQNRCNSSRANSTDTDVPQKLPVALKSHNCRFQWLAVT